MQGGPEEGHRTCGASFFDGMPWERMRASAPRRGVRVGCWIKTGALELAAILSELGGRDAVVWVPGLTDLPAGSAVQLLLAGAGSGARAKRLGGVVLEATPHTSGDAQVLGLEVALDAPLELTEVLAKTDALVFGPVVLVGRAEVMGGLSESVGAVFETRRCSDGREFVEACRLEPPSVVLVDADSRAKLAADIEASLAAYSPASCLVMISSSEGRPTGAASTAGLADPVQALSFQARPDVALAAVRQAMEVHLKRLAVSRQTVSRQAAPALALAPEVLRRPDTATFDQIVGTSRATTRLLKELEQTRNSAVTVHLHGETGVGKELVARALHAISPRAHRPLVAVNCAGMTDTLVESTLFGYVKGAFTGATQDRRGLFEEANGGCLFLDEVADLSPVSQAALLRVLQTGEIRPVGSVAARAIDVRVISATNKNLEIETREGRFRADLYFRLAVMVIEVPPLRERAGDVPLLAAHLLAAAARRHRKSIVGFAPETMDLLESFDWPGNVREMQNAIERAVVLTPEGGIIQPAALPASLRHRLDRSAPSALLAQSRSLAPDAAHAGLGLDALIDDYTREVIDRVLADSGGNITRAAQILGVERSRLSRLRKRLKPGQA